MYSTRRLCVRQDIRPRIILFVASMQHRPVFTLIFALQISFLSITTSTSRLFSNKFITSYKFNNPKPSTGNVNLFSPEASVVYT